jgi:Icc-related predicted phosphoesterase
MRCLLVADIHYSLPQYDWVVGESHKYDVLILAGDHLDVSSGVDCRAQSIVVEKYLDLLRERTRLIVCSGNHDLDTRDDAGEKVSRWVANLRRKDIATDGDNLFIDGVLFTVCPWWDGPVARERVGALLEEASGLRQGPWYWVYHAPPHGSPVSWTGSRSLGDAPLSEWIGIYCPDVVFSGHVHQSPFVREGSWVDRIGNTWVFNAGHQYGSPPAHVAFDTEANEAVWLSAAGIQSVLLGDPITRPLPRLRMPPQWFMDRDPGQIPA